MQSNVLGSITNKCMDDRAGQCEILSFVVYREQACLGDESLMTLCILFKLLNCAFAQIMNNKQMGVFCAHIQLSKQD